MAVQFYVSLTKMGKLPPGKIAIKRGRRAAISSYTPDLLDAIKNFAKFRGLRFIEEKTVHKLRTDKLFKYCFSPLVVLYDTVYEDQSEFGGEIRERLFGLLKDPDQATAEDLWFGLDCYLGNFAAYMPGGQYRSLAGKGSIWQQGFQSLINRIDQVLKERAYLEKADNLQAEAAEEKKTSPCKRAEKDGRSHQQNVDYVKRLTYLEFCLEIFHVLVEKGEFSPIELRT